MILFYRLFINLVFILSPFIILVRLLKKKENMKEMNKRIKALEQIAKKAGHKGRHKAGHKAGHKATCHMCSFCLL